MSETQSVEKYASELKRMERVGSPYLDVAVAGYLESELSELEPKERLRFLEELRDRFSAEGTSGSDQDMRRLVLQFLGSSSSGVASSAELVQKFAASLDLLFDSLNEIISVINVTLLGQNPELETIRKVIGSNIEKGGDNLCVKEYLDQIRHAFLTAHGSFQDAAGLLLAQVISELDPAALLQAKNAGLKFGPLRKAELFEQYEEKHARCKRWFDSGQYKESLLREFEKNCRQKFNKTVG